MLYFIDEEKAFDRVEWGFLKAVFDRMRFSPLFMLWIEFIYSTQYTEISLEGFKSSTISLLKTVRHGCPLLPVLFDIMIETLTRAVRENRSIWGIGTPLTKHINALCQ